MATKIHATMPARTPATQARRPRHVRPIDCRGLFEIATCGLYRATPDGRFVAANPALARIYGYPSSAALLAAAIGVGGESHADPDQWSGLVRRIEAGDIVTGIEGRVRRPDGSIAWIAQTIRGVRDRAGRLRHIDGAVEDVTARKEADASRRAHAWLREAVDGLVEGLLVWDEADRLVLHNRAARELLWPQGEPLPAPGTPRAAIVERIHGPGQGAEIPARQHRADGAPVEAPWLSQRRHPIASGGSVTVLVDVTASKQAADLLRQSGHRYWTLYRKTPAILHSIDRSGRLLNVSDHWLAVMGYDRDAVIGRPITDFMAPESASYAREVVWPVYFRTGHCVDVPYQFVKRTGEVIEARLTATAERDDLGHVVRSLEVMVDVTRLTKAEAALRDSERNFRTLVENSPDLIVRFDRACRRVYVNPAFAAATQVAGHWLGAAQPEGAAQSDGAALLPVAADYQQRLETVIATGAADEMDVEIAADIAGRDDTSYYALRMVPEFDRQRRVTGVLVIGRDVSARVRAEQEARRSEARAAAANSAKSQFLANMSHELRTPLNAIIGFAELLLMDLDRCLSPRHRGYGRNIVAAGEHLHRLVSDVLDLASLETNPHQLPLEQVDVPAVLTRVQALMRPIAAKAGIRLMIEGWTAPPVAADARRLVQVLVNLLSNGIKYNRPNGAVWLVVRAAGPTVRFAVRDTGLGIDTAGQDRLFKPFERLGAETTAIEGTGIGLVLVKSLIDAMRGRMGFASQPGEGSLFWVELQAAT